MSVRHHEMKNQLTRKVGFEGTPKLDSCWKSQPVTCKVNLIVNVPPADDELVARVPKKQENRKRSVYRLDDNLLVVAQQ